MKKTIWIVTVIFLLTLVAAVPVFAQGSDETKAPGTWVSSINIQNTGTGAADQIHIIFYKPDGTEVLNYLVTPAIPVDGSRSFYVPSEIPGLTDGQFSVVIQSGNPLQVVANSSSTFPATAGAYTGFQADQIGTELFFPGLYKNYYNFWSELVLQNTDAASNNIKIEFFSQTTGAKISGADVTATIPGNGSKVFALQDLTSVPSGNTNGLLSAKVTSTSSLNLAGVANIWSSAYNGEFGDYNGYTTGSTTVVYTPALYKNYYGFVSSLTVQNIDTVDANIKVTYSNGSTETKLLKPLQAVQYYQPNNASLPSGNTNGVFSAKVESLDGKEIVALVNVEDKTKGLLASYNGPAGATTKVGCPVVMKTFYGWFSAETVQNVGTNPTNITITYASGQSKTFNNVPANGTVNFVELASAGSVLPDASSVSAVISSSGEPIVAVVQEDSKDRYAVTPGDYLLAYTCVAQP
jgi:hypothetical protein